MYAFIWKMCLLVITIPPNAKLTLFNDTKLSLNPLWPSDTIWHWKSVSSLVQIMVCCLMAPTHYLSNVAELHAKFHSDLKVSTPNRLATSRLCEILCLITKAGPAESYRADSGFAPSQWEMSLQSNAVSHWLDANLESALGYLSQSITKPTTD